MLDEIIIRPISFDDNETISAIIKNTLIEYDGNKPGTAFNDESLLNMFATYQNENEQYFVALLNGNLVGGCGIAQLDNNLAICELQKMYISPEGRGKKVGKKLLDVCLEFATASGYRQCYLETFSTMYDAIHLYTKNKFFQIQQPIGSTGHDACNTWFLRDLTK